MGSATATTLCPCVLQKVLRESVTVSAELLPWPPPLPAPLALWSSLWIHSRLLRGAGQAENDQARRGALQ